MSMYSRLEEKIKIKVRNRVPTQEKNKTKLKKNNYMLKGGHRIVRRNLSIN